MSAAAPLCLLLLCALAATLQATPVDKVGDYLYCNEASWGYVTAQPVQMPTYTAMTSQLQYGISIPTNSYCLQTAGVKVHVCDTAAPLSVQVPDPQHAYVTRSQPVWGQLSFDITVYCNPPLG